MPTGAEPRVKTGAETGRGSIGSLMAGAHSLRPCLARTQLPGAVGKSAERELNGSPSGPASFQQFARFDQLLNRGDIDMELAIAIHEGNLRSDHMVSRAHTPPGFDG